MRTSSNVRFFAHLICKQEQAVLSTDIVFLLVLFLLAACLLLPQTAVAQNKTVLILAPHPDDEALCCSGIIYSAKAQGDTVKLVVATNGDSYAPGVPLGYQREAESVAAMSLLGLSEQDVIFLGYGDQDLLSLYQSSSPTAIITSEAGQTQTYANRGLGGTDYHSYLYGTPGPYNRQTALGDFEAVLKNLDPDEIYTTSSWDDHPDHSATFLFLMEALRDLRAQGLSLSPRVHETLIHAPCASCGLPDYPSYLWPGGGPGFQPAFNPAPPYSQPYYLTNLWPNGNNTPYNWDGIEIVPLPAPMQSTDQSANLKAQVIAKYVSQGGTDPANYLFAFVKKNEFFWIHDFATNLADLATVTVSSQSPDSGQLGTSAVDGVIEGYPGYASTEWATQGELAGAWIKLTWQRPVTISHVVLYNRQDLVDDVLSGTLRFSDGSTVQVGQLPINGNGSLISFSPRTVTSLQFTVNNAVGQNIGLTEIEVYGRFAGTSVNRPQIFSGPVASAPLQNDPYGQSLVPSITDAQTTSFSVVAFDVDGQNLSYSWSSDSGTFSGTGSTAIFNPPVVAIPTTVTTSVTVNDGMGGTAQNSGYITVTPSNSSGISVSSLTFNPASVASGSTAVGTVTLNHSAQHGAVVALSSSNPAVASVPATVIVPPGASSVSFQASTVYVTSTSVVTISASLGGITRNASITVLQPPVTVSSLTFNPPTVGGGNLVTGTVTLTGPAVAGGSAVSLTSSSPSVATVPASVTVPAGQTSANFTITTQALTSAVSVPISAAYVGQTTTSNLRVSPYVAPNLATIAAVSVSSETTAYNQQGIKAIDGIVDGSPGDYTREWATNGQLSGAWIRLAWSVPVTISQVILFDRPNLTDNITSGTLTFSDGSSVPVSSLPNDGSPMPISFSQRTATWMQFTVNSAVGQNIGLAEIAVIGSITSASAISAVTVNPTSVTAGTPVTGTVVLNGVAPPSGTVVSLASSNQTAAVVPSSVTVPGGSLTATFPITTHPVGSVTPVTISGSYNGTQGTAALTLNPVALSSLSLNPTMVTGGASTVGTVVLNGAAPAGGATVALMSGNTSVATVPSTVTVPAGTTTTTFAVGTSVVNSTTALTISASYNSTQGATLFVTPQIEGGGGMQQFAADNFARPDGGLGVNWTTILDSDNPPSIVGQQVQSSYNRTKAMYYGGINWPADQYAQAQIVAQNAGSIGPAVRMTSNGTFYAGTVSDLGNGTASAYIMLDEDGSTSILASGSGLTILPNDYIRLSVTGTTLTLTDVTSSTVLLTVTDSTVPAGYPGFYVGGTGTILANWSAGVTSAPAGLTTLATDDFDRANAPNLGSNWSIGPGYYSIQIVNDEIESAGQGQAPGTGHGKEYYTAIAFPGDQWSQAQVISASNDVNGAIVRYQGTIDTHYVGFVSNIGPPGTCSISIDRDINAAPVVLMTDSTYCSVSSGDYIRLQAQGSLLSLIDVTTGSLLGAVLDSQITGGSPGWSLNPGGGTPTAAHWSGGQVGP